mgnify:CR=1 FL=1
MRGKGRCDSLEGLPAELALHGAPLPLLKTLSLHAMFVFSPGDTAALAAADMPSLTRLKISPLVAGALAPLLGAPWAAALEALAVQRVFFPDPFFGVIRYEEGGSQGAVLDMLTLTRADLPALARCAS